MSSQSEKEARDRKLWTNWIGIYRYIRHLKVRECTKWCHSVDSTRFPPLVTSRCVSWMTQEIEQMGFWTFRPREKWSESNNQRRGGGSEVFSLALTSILL